MRTWFVTLLLLTACKADRPAAGADPVAKDPPAEVPADARPTTAAPTPGGFAGYKEALAAGRTLGKDAGRLGEARAAFEAALAHQPGDATALSELGWVEFRLGDHAAALVTTDRAIAAAKPPALRAASLYNRGRILEEQGDLEGAMTAYRESVDLRPNDTVSRRFVRLYEQAGAGEVKDDPAVVKPHGIALFAARYPTVRSVPWAKQPYACGEGCTPTVHQVVYGDVESDGIEEAVVVMNHVNRPTEDQTAHLYGVHRGAVVWLGQVHQGGLEHPEYAPSFVEAKLGGGTARVTWRWHLWGHFDDPADEIETGVETYAIRDGRVARIDD